MTVLFVVLQLSMSIPMTYVTVCISVFMRMAACRPTYVCAYVCMYVCRICGAFRSSKNDRNEVQVFSAGFVSFGDGRSGTLGPVFRLRGFILGWVVFFINTE